MAHSSHLPETFQTDLRHYTNTFQSLPDTLLRLSRLFPDTKHHMRGHLSDTLNMPSRHSPNSLQISYPKTFRHHPVVLNWYAPRIHTVTWLKVLTDTNTFLDIHTNTNTDQLTLNEFFWSEHSFFEKRSRGRKKIEGKKTSWGWAVPSSAKLKLATH